MMHAQALIKTSLEFGDVNKLIKDTINTPEWEKLQSEFNKKDRIVIVGHGGNLAVSDHISVDISRLTKGQKTTLCPGSAIQATSFINDSSFDQWMQSWFKSNENLLDPSNTLIIGISSSGKSRDIKELFDYTVSLGYSNFLISAKPSSMTEPDFNVITGAESYHSSEIVALALGYQLVHGYGHHCPNIN